MARNIFKGLDKLVEGYHTEEGRRKPKKQIKEAKTRTEIRLGDRIYPIKDKEFLKGKVAGYGNEYGLEHVRTVKYSDGTSYKIYDSGFGNIGHADACAVLIEKLKGDVPPKGYEKPTSVKGDWIWDEVRYDWYNRDTGSYYAEIESKVTDGKLKEALYGKKEFDEFITLCDKLGLKTFGDLEKFADNNKNRILVNDLLCVYDLSMSIDAFFQTLRDRVAEKDEFEYDDPLNVIKNRNKNESLDNNTKNIIEVEVKSGINGDGFKVIVKDIDGSTIEQEDFYYGYNASYSKSWADKKAPFVTDIINNYLSKYNLSKDDLVLTKGKNVFRDKDVSDEVITRFKTDYLSEGLTDLNAMQELIPISDNKNENYIKKGDRVKLSSNKWHTAGQNDNIGRKGTVVGDGFHGTKRYLSIKADDERVSKFGYKDNGYDAYEDEVEVVDESFDEDYEKAWTYEVYRVSDGELLATDGGLKSREVAVKYAEEAAQSYEEQGYGECDYDVFEDTDLTPTWNRKKTIYESKQLNEGHEQYDYKGFSIDLDDDQFHNIKRHGSGNIVVEIKIGDAVYATVNGYDAAEEWIDKNGQKILDEIAAKNKKEEERNALIDACVKRVQVSATGEHYANFYDEHGEAAVNVSLSREDILKAAKIGSGGIYQNTSEGKSIPISMINGFELYLNWDITIPSDTYIGVGLYVNAINEDEMYKLLGDPALVGWYKVHFIPESTEEVKEFWKTEILPKANEIAHEIVENSWRSSKYSNYDGIYEALV